MGAGKEWFEEPREITRSNAAELILEDILKGIRTGEVSVGSRLPSETLLAKRYGVSRPVVREALRVAQSLGLTNTRMGSGTYVTSDTPKLQHRFGNYATRDLMEARPAIEVPSARLAAERRSERQAAELLKICDHLEQVSRPQEWVKLDSLLHASIAEASGNAVFAAVVFDTKDSLSQQSEIINLVAHRRQASDIEHREIAEAIAAQDPERAERAMKAHLRFVEDVLRPMLKEAG